MFFSDLQGLADTSTRVLGDNERNLIRVGQVTEPVLKLLADLLAGVPVPARGRAPSTRRVLAKTFEGNQVKQYIEFGTAQYSAYDARRPPGVRRDRPRPVVLGPAQPRGPDRAGRRSRTAPTSTPTRPARRVPPSSRRAPVAAARRQPRRVRRHRGREDGRQRAARRADRTRRGLLRRARLAAVRTRGEGR